MGDNRAFGVHVRANKNLLVYPAGFSSVRHRHRQFPISAGKQGISRIKEDA